MLNIKSPSKILYFISVVLFFCALLVGESSAFLPHGVMISDILLRGMFIFLFLGSVFSLWENVYEYSWIYVLFFLVTAVFWILSCYKCIVAITPSERMNAGVGHISLTASLILWIINYFRGRKKNKCHILLKRYIPLVIICMLYVILFLFNYSVWMHIDSAAYYYSIAGNAGRWRFSFADMDALAMGGHTSYAYSVLLMIGELLAPKLGYGQRAVNCVLSVVTIIAFYFIVEKIWGRDKQIRSVLLTVIFAFAPLFYGISYLVSTDFPLLCFFTLLLAAAFYKIKFLRFIMILCVCFSKETGVFLLAGLYFGEVIADFMKEKRSVRAFLKKLFALKRLVMYSPAFLYVWILLFGNNGWSKNFRYIFSPPNNVEIPTGTYTWWHYPIFKLFECFFMNFYWLLWVLLVIAALIIIGYCRNKKKKVNVFLGEALSPYADYYIPIIVVYFVFCILGIAYFTYIHYRYVQVGHLFYVLCLGIIVNIIPQNSLKKELLLLPFVFFMSIESFFLIDPVTYLFFDNFDIGNGHLVSTRQYWGITIDEETGLGYFWEADEPTMNEHYLAEGTEYNRESIGLQRVMEKCFKKIRYTSDTLIVLDIFGGWDSNTCRQIFGLTDCNGWFWDPDIGTVVRYDTGIPLNMIYDNSDIENCSDSFSRVYYIDFPFNKYHQNTVLEDYPAVDSFSVSHFRWKIDVYKLK